MILPFPVILGSLREEGLKTGATGNPWQCNWRWTAWKMNSVGLSWIVKVRY